MLGLSWIATSMPVYIRRRLTYVRDSYVICKLPKVTRLFVTFSDTILAEHRGLTRAVFSHMNSPPIELPFRLRNIWAYYSSYPRHGPRGLILIHRNVQL